MYEVNTQIDIQNMNSAKIFSYLLDGPPSKRKSVTLTSSCPCKALNNPCTSKPIALLLKNRETIPK